MERPSSKKRTRAYGIWLLTPKRGIEAPQVWRETRAGVSAPTRFQRAVGVEYSRGPHPRFPDSKGGYFGYSRHGPPQSLLRSLKGFFRPTPLPHQNYRLKTGIAKRLRSSSAYAVLWSPHIQYKSIPGLAWFAGKIYVREDEH